jgi:hypothetical protein
VPLFALLLLGAALARGQAVPEAAPRPEGLREKIELSIQAGLKYIAANQKPDGSFVCEKYAPAVTGLGCLAILANRDDRLPEVYERALARGIEYILRQQNEAGFVGQYNMYEHAIATLAVLQYLGMGPAETDARLAEFCRKAIQVTVAAQRMAKARRDAGGWHYDANAAQSDISNTSWQLLMLFSAAQCGYAVDPECFQQALEYVRLCRQKEGYGYTPAFTRRSGTAYRSVTGVAVFLRELLAPGSAAKEPDVVQWLASVPPSWGGKQYRGYFFSAGFYLSQGLFQVGGRRWEEYFERLATILIEHQESDGHWPFPEDYLEEGRKAGPIYATSLAVLQLSLDKQYLPIYQRQHTITD